ncbi:MAG: DUF1289 domain-containing protein [Lysobacter sp.]|nr:MAG: DUF1289 domain-containing protein [Lysobacter sp.]
MAMTDRTPPASVRAVLTPCIGVCTLDPAGYCDGCLRTTDEICDWLDMNEQQRLHIMNVVLPEREARLAQGGLVGSQG